MENKNDLVDETTRINIFERYYFDLLNFNTSDDGGIMMEYIHDALQMIDNGRIEKTDVGMKFMLHVLESVCLINNEGSNMFECWLTDEGNEFFNILEEIKENEGFDAFYKKSINK